jgi:transposase
MSEKREGAREQGRKTGEKARVRGGRGGVDDTGVPSGDGGGALALLESGEGGRGEPGQSQSRGREARRVVPALGRADPEVVPQARRRTFSGKYKLGILEKVDACTEPGQIGALLRRQGLYSSTLRTWRRQREQGVLTGLAPKKRGPRADPDKELLKRLEKLEKENLRLANKLEKAELIIEVQKKVARLLGAEQPENRDGSK